MAIAPPSPADLAAFSSLRNTADIAALFATTKKRLTFHLYSKSRPRYRLFKIPKATGGWRIIAVPPLAIRAFQRKLLACMTSCVVPKGPAHGFTPKKSVVTNARQHVGAAVILNVDLQDFFPSIHFGRILGVFTHLPFAFNTEVATVLAQICSYNTSLPPGAPTSPILSNLICRGLDRDLLSLAKQHRCKYTRYADDITFSTSAPSLPSPVLAQGQPHPVLGDDFAKIIERHDMRPNAAKIHVKTREERQQVTGLVVNRRLNLQRRYIRNIRAILHDCEQRGIKAAEEEFRRRVGGRRATSPSLVAHLRGKLDYLRMVKGDADSVYLRYALRLEKLAPSREFGVCLAGPCALEDQFLLQAIWIIVGKDKDGTEVVQGTAFGLDGVGLVSAAHVLESDEKDPDRPVTWEARRASSPQTSFRIEGHRSTSGLDLAIIDMDAPSPASLRATDRLVQVGDKVTLAGFPNWFQGDTLELQHVRVIQPKSASGIRYIITGANVRAGASGGPMLNDSGLVVGVTLSDGSAPVSPNGGLAIGHVNDLLRMTDHRPVSS